MPTRQRKVATPGGAVIRIEESVVVARLRAQVFAVAADPTKMPLWNHAVKESTLVGRLRKGARVLQVVEVLGRRFDAEFEVTSYEPGLRVAYTSIGGPLSVEGAMEFRADRGRTHVTWIVEGEARGFIWVAERVLLGLGRPEMQACLENLRDVVEGGSPRPHRPNPELAGVLVRTPLRLLGAVASLAAHR